MTRCPVGTIKKTAHRKATWRGQYNQFSSFAPVACKRGLIKTLFYRTRNICSAGPVQNGVPNGYSEAKTMSLQNYRVIIALPGSRVANVYKERHIL